MNILSVDFGTKNIGLAWCDTAIGVVLPFGTVKTADDVATVIRQEKINLVIIGMPTGTDGKSNPNTERVRDFADKLRQETGVPVEFTDERFSSLAADRMGGGVSRDERSAMILLQDHLSRNKK